MQSKNSALRKIARLYERNLVATAAVLAEQYIVRYPKDGYVWLYYGACLARMSRFTGANRALRQAVRLLPSARRHLAYYNLGQLHERKGAIRLAEACYRRAIENSPRRPSDAGYRIMLGRLLYNAGRLHEAKVLLRGATRCEEGCLEETFLFLGMTLCALEKYKDARRCFIRALEIDPKYKVAKKELTDIEYALQEQRIV